MRRFLIVSLALFCALTMPAQNKQVRAQKNKTESSRQKQATPKNQQAGKEKATSKSSHPKAKRSQQARKQPTTKKTRNANTAQYTNASIRGLQSQRSGVQKKIRQQERALKNNKAKVTQKLRELMAINGEIDQKQKSIDGIQQDLKHINDNIDMLQTQLETLQQQLANRKARYVKSMRYMAQHHSVEDRIMFVFSARNFVQMYRRLRFVRQYADFQKAQGELLKTKQAQIDIKHKQLQQVKGQKHTLLSKDQKARTELESKQGEQQEMVKTLQKQQKTIQSVLDEQRKKDAALNAEIDRQVAIEVEKARARAAAEAKRKAEAAAEAKRKAAELARKKAEAEAIARENARRVEEARKRENLLRAQAEANKQADKAAKERAEQAAREAQADREAAERKARADEERNKQTLAKVKIQAEEATMLSSDDRRLSGSFASNKGRLPMPITGSSRIVAHQGRQKVAGLEDVWIEKKGIDIKGQPGCRARSVFDGVVTKIFGWQGNMVVMVRHGAYITVYCNLQSVSVASGQKVAAMQALGTVNSGNVLQFQLRRETAILNPEAWIRR